MEITDDMIRPSVADCLDLGYEIAEMMLLKAKPLTDRQLLQYVLAVIHRHPSISTRESLSENDCMLALALADSNLDQLSKCSPPVPRDIMARLCLCSIQSLKDYNRMAMDSIVEASRNMLKDNDFDCPHHMA